MSVSHLSDHRPQVTASALCRQNWAIGHDVVSQALRKIGELEGRLGTSRAIGNVTQIAALESELAIVRGIVDRVAAILDDLPAQLAAAEAWEARA